MPYTIPKEWALTRIGVICGSIVPNRDKPKSFSGGFPWITLSNFSDKDIKLLRNHTGLGLSQEEVIKFNARIIPSKSVLMSCVGRFGLVAVLEQDVVANQQIHGFVAPSFLCPEYVAYVIKAHTQFLESSATSTTVSYLNKTRCESIPFPLPPLAEQKRIVEKVDELMALCDRLAAAKQTRDDLRQKLRGSAIAALMNAETDEALEKSWAIVRDDWQTISQDPKDVDGLRKSVLQLAARGKLVSQDTEDEAAAQLLQKAIREKALMAQAGLIPKPRQSSPISEDECPFPLPSSWEWVRLEDICSHIVDCLHRTPKYQHEGYPAIRTSEMRPGKILFEQARKVGREDYEMQTQRLVPKAGDVFYSREGSFGIAAVVPEGVEMCLSQRMMQFRAVSEVNPHFFSWVMNSSVMYRQASRDVVGMTVPHVNIRSLKEFVFPLAPYAEQKRIVAKVDELMQMCDQLEESLRQSQQRAEALAASAISHLTI